MIFANDGDGGGGVGGGMWGGGWGVGGCYKKFCLGYLTLFPFP